ncbi:hypothetical protein GCM10010253_39220 [Streptomyces badius]|uniref:Uncharacterized protein n=1 Tax=Streptomyces badius TaxID=1941 RepID=A0ABQ2TAT8_STRBA|nr:hypothetical protein GCM10010253_39220 [Streptomyces badius]
MDEEEVQVVEAQLLQGTVERPARLVGCVRAVVQLARDEDVGAVEPGFPDRLADLLLVAVHLRRVDVPVAGLQSGDRGLAGLVRRDLEGPEAELRDRHTVVEGDGRY